MLSVVSFISSSAGYIKPTADNFQILGCLWTRHHRCTCKWNWTEILTFFSVESKDCMDSASYEYRKMSARRGAQFVPIGMPTVCWKTFPAKTTKILSTRKSGILMMSSSEYLGFFNRSAPSQNMFHRALIPNICIYGYHCSPSPRDSHIRIVDCKLGYKDTVNWRICI